MRISKTVSCGKDSLDARWEEQIMQPEGDFERRKNEVWKLQMERKSQFHSYFWSYPEEYSQKKKKKRFKESSGLLALSLTIIIIILVIIIICYLIVPRGSINNLHTESDSHLLGLLKGEAVAPSAWTGAWGGVSVPLRWWHRGSVQSPHCGWGRYQAGSLILPAKSLWSLFQPWQLEATHKAGMEQYIHLLLTFNLGQVKP